MRNKPKVWIAPSEADPQMSLLPEMEDKHVDVAVDRVKMAWKFHHHMNPDGEPMLLAFSGGKDSICLFFVCKKAAEELGIPMERMFNVVYNITCMDPPEVVQFVRNVMKKEYPFITMRHPEKTMWQLIVDSKLPPSRESRYCCRLLKEVHNAKGAYTLTGVRRAESEKRGGRKGFETAAKYKEDRILLNDNGDDRRESEYCMQKRAYICNPIIDWSDDDVWNFIRRNNLPYCSLYDEGFFRVGCIGCPLANDRDRVRDFERWPGYKRQFIRTFDKTVESIKQSGKPWTAKFEMFKDGQDMFDWWMHDPEFWRRRQGAEIRENELFSQEADDDEE